MDQDQTDPTGASDPNPHSFLRAFLKQISRRQTANNFFVIVVIYLFQVITCEIPKRF